jgi:dipeptide/tripeptide permease
MSFAEMLIAPLSYAISIEYGPKALQGALIGFCQLTTGVSGTVSDYLSKLQNGHPMQLKFIAPVFLIYACLGIGVGFGLLAAYKIFRLLFSN